jgi:nanoRNase/pAp phosphatase (c-di-AMP/oligoRNAs hydrolase)
MAGRTLKRSDRLLSVLDEYDRTAVIMHNNPDPDAIATGWAISTLVECRLRKTARLLGRGPVLRAENLQFINLLQPPMELVEDMPHEAHTATVLVDCSPASANHLLGGRQAPVAVIDHHVSKGDGFRIPFRDMRPKVTASASIAAAYMREQRLRLTPPLATALLYAIRTEMIGARKALSRLDHSAVRWLSGFANYDVLSKIENPPLPRYYYEELLLGLDRVLVYSDSAVCFLPRITAPEIVGEVADLLIRCDSLKYVLCGGRVADTFLLSARSKSEEHSALTLLDHVLRGLGHFGGHLHRAGGKVSLPVRGMDSEGLEQEVRKRWLHACGTTLRRGQRLVGRKEIMRGI